MQRGRDSSKSEGSDSELRKSELRESELRKGYIVKVIKEGTHIYLQEQIMYTGEELEDTGLEYYLSVEYEVLKHNSLKTLLKSQLREKDGEKTLLFDITGRQPLKQQERSRSFSQEECKRVLRSMILLLEEIDDYMLNLNCVQFQAEYIYIDAEGSLQWVYLPQSNMGIQGNIEEFFAWMLTQINYEDAKAVRFMYQLYNKIRKLGFSKELLESSIPSEEEEEGPDAGIPQETYSKNQYNQYNQYDQYNPDRESVWQDTNTDFPKEDKNKSKLTFLYECMRIIFCIFFSVVLGSDVWFVFSGMKAGFSELLFRYCIGGILLLGTLLGAIIWISIKLKKQKELCPSRTGKEKSQESVEEVKKAEYPMTIKTDVEWESKEGGTTLLSGSEDGETIPEKLLCPMLREVETGIVYIIKNCPFYIGSAAGVNQLEIKDRTVSREHAVILEEFWDKERTGYIIRDMNSTNGTWIDDKKVKKGGQSKLKDGDIIRFAKKEYKFLLQDI